MFLETHLANLNEHPKSKKWKEVLVKFQEVSQRVEQNAKSFFLNRTESLRKYRAYLAIQHLNKNIS